MRRTLTLALTFVATLAAAATVASAGERAPSRGFAVQAEVQDIGGRKHHFRGHHKRRHFGGHHKRRDFRGHHKRRHVGPRHRHFSHKHWKRKRYHAPKVWHYRPGPRRHFGPPRHTKRWHRGPRHFKAPPPRTRHWNRGHHRDRRHHGRRGKFVFILPFGR